MSHKTFELTRLFTHNLYFFTSRPLAFALLYAAYLTYRTRDAPDAVNESKSFSSAVFLITFVCIAGLPIVLSLPLDPYVTQMIVGLLFFIATMGANGFYFGQKMFYLLQGADLNAQFKIVYANGKSVGNAIDKSPAKGAKALAKLLIDSMKAAGRNSDTFSRKKSMSNSVNDASGDQGSLEKVDSEKELEATLQLIKPDEKAYFLSHDVREI